MTEEERTLKAEKDVAPIIRKVTTKRLSICDCGFPLLNDAIPLGTEYRIVPVYREDDEIICGGCRKHLPVKTVYALSNTGGVGGYLPLKIFEP